MSPSRPRAHAAHQAFDAPTPSQAADAQLLADLRQGDRAACVPLMRKYSRLMFGAARSILKDDAQAEHAVQEAWLRAFAALHSFRADDGLPVWLVRIVMRQARLQLHQHP